MKRFTFFATIVLLFLLSTKSWSQDFAVTISSTDNYQHYIIPLKAGGSLQFQINVKNNRTDTCTVSIDKTSMGITGQWVTIDNNSQKLFPQQSTNFLLTLSIPANTSEGVYAMFLYFNAYDKTNFNHSFNYTAQTVTVDNSVPVVPSFAVSTTSKTVSASSWNSYDAMSSTYTTANSSSGISGIKSYTVTLKNPDNSVKETKTINATSVNYYNFQALSSNTAYKVSVTATDLAGNSNTKELTATTAPAAPTISSTTQGFCNITLNWTVSSGATSYKLYDATSTPVLVTTTSNTSTIVSGLTSGMSYKFYVIAYNGNGSASDVGNTLSISTLTVPIPIISGPLSVCPSGASFSVTNLPSDCTLAWSQGPGLSLFSASGNTATFTATGNNTSWIKATINSGCGIATATTSVDAGTPIPGTIAIQFDAPPRRFTASINGMATATSYKWYLNGILKFNTTETVVIFQRQVGNCGFRYDVDVTMENSCGTSQISHTEVYEPECYSSYNIYPNPALSEISITQNPELKQLSVATENPNPKIIKSIKIIDNMGLIYVNKKYGKGVEVVKLNVTGLKTGTYQIIINEGEDQENQILLKSEN